MLLMELFGTGVAAPVAVGTVLGYLLGRPWTVYRYGAAVATDTRPAPSRHTARMARNSFSEGQRK